jgi:hypothetical protein
MRNTVYYSRLGRGVHGRPPLRSFLKWMQPPHPYGRVAGGTPLSNWVPMKNLNEVYDGECGPGGADGKGGFTPNPPSRK